MRGAVELVNARLRGFSPAVVFVDLDIPPIPELHRSDEQVQIEAGDRLSSLDLRCVYGLLVCVSGENAEKARAIASACMEAGALRVITTLHRVLKGRHEAIEVTDTLGVLEWKKSN